MQPSQRQAEPVALVAISSQTLTNSFAAAVLLLALGGLATQSLAIATGRDFVFGLIPKLNPAGPRNIPVWFVSAAFALCAALAVVPAFVHRRPSGRLAHRWIALSVALALLSAERLGHVVSGLERIIVAPAFGISSPTFTWILFALAVGTYGWCLQGLPRKVRSHFVVAAAAFFSGFVLCLFAPSNASVDPVHQRVTHMLFMSVGRLLELAGIAIFVEAIAATLRSQLREIRVAVDGKTARLCVVEKSSQALFVQLSPRRVRFFLLAVATALLTAGFAAAVSHEILGLENEAVYRSLGVDFEGNLPTWFSSLLLLACAVVLAGIAVARRSVADAQWRPWALLSLLFVGLSADEAAAIHELSVMPLRSIVSDNPWLRYPLVIPGIGAAAVIYGFFARFFSSLPQTTRRTLFAGFGFILFGALGIETAGGWFDPTVYGPSLAYALLSTLEEGFEMAGAITILSALLFHIEGYIGTLRLPGRAERVAS